MKIYYYDFVSAVALKAQRLPGSYFPLLTFLTLSFQASSKIKPPTTSFINPLMYSSRDGLLLPSMTLSKLFYFVNYSAEVLIRMHYAIWIL